VPIIDGDCLAVVIQNILNECCIAGHVLTQALTILPKCKELIMFLAEHERTELIVWRRELHSKPELSGQEEKTAQAVQALLHATGADKVVTGLGGHGVLGIYEGDTPGPTIMLRAELDGLPIQETSELA
jgi:metal-dependent amidase/aminoacylase/carboxypeptidase family protein